MGFALGAVRFIFEVLDKSVHYQSEALRRLVDMNFLHYAVLMFVVCTFVLIAVSMLYPAPERKKIAGLTFATVDEKLDTTSVKSQHIEKETRREQFVNLAFTALLLIIVVGLWIHFR